MNPAAILSIVLWDIFQMNSNYASTNPKAPDNDVPPKTVLRKHFRLQAPHHPLYTSSARHLERQTTQPFLLERYDR